MRALDILTDYFRLELRGPSRTLPSSPASDSPPMLAIRLGSGDQLRHCLIAEADGSTRNWSPGEPGPYLFEDTDYHLVLEALNVQGPVHVKHRDPQLLASIAAIPGHKHLATGTLNFRRQIGLTTLTISSGEHSLALTIEVYPSKIDYRTDYEALINDLYKVAHGLALEYLRSTFHGAATTSAAPGSEIEWLIMLANHVAELDRALAYIAEHPHRTLTSTDSIVRAERIRHPGHTTQRAVLRGQGHGPWMNLPQLGPLRSQLPTGRPSETLDNAEHRWLRREIAASGSRIGQILERLQNERVNLQRAQRTTQHVATEISELTQIAEKLTRWLNTSPFADAVGPVRPQFSSLTFFGRPGYREAYRALLTLRMALALTGDTLQTSVKDLDVLYEAWCFVKVVSTVCKLLGAKIDPVDLLEIREDGIRVRLRKGQQSTVRLDDKDRSLKISYNQKFRDLTGEQIPDIIIEFNHAGWPAIIVILDAKYQLESSSRYLSAFSSPGPPIDAINVLHRYRDAITVRTNQEGRGRPVVKGAALFPLAQVNIDSFRKHRLWESLKVLGIGAVPLIPGDSSLLEEWLTALLALNPSALAEPGPPFLAWEFARDSTCDAGHEA